MAPTVLCAVVGRDATRAARRDASKHNMNCTQPCCGVYSTRVTIALIRLEIIGALSDQLCTLFTGLFSCSNGPLMLYCFTLLCNSVKPGGKTFPFIILAFLWANSRQVIDFNDIFEVYNLKVMKRWLDDTLLTFGRLFNWYMVSNRYYFLLSIGG